jgi:hypothetical protein
LEIEEFTYQNIFIVPQLIELFVMFRFGVYSRWPFFGDRKVYLEDSLNNFPGAGPHHVRVYELKDETGNVVQNAYLLTFEETTEGFVTHKELNLFQFNTILHTTF